MKMHWVGIGFGVAFSLVAACGLRDEIASIEGGPDAGAAGSAGAGGMGGGANAGGMAGSGAMGGSAGMGGGGAGGGPAVDIVGDWRDAIAYYVFVDRFRNGDPSNDGAPIANVPPAADYQGGDWQGIIDAIKEGYFTQLGVTSLWLGIPFDNPDVAHMGMDGKYSSAYHGGWPVDLYQPESRFGTLAKLQELVSQAHSVGLTVVMHHSTRHMHQSAPIYQMQPELFDQTGCSCSNMCAGTCWFTDFLPPFHQQLLVATQYQLDNLAWWGKQTQVDGFFFSAVKQLAPQWSTEARKLVDVELEPITGRHVFLGGDMFTGNGSSIKEYINPQTALDGQFDYPLRAQIVEKILMRQGTMTDLEQFLSVNDLYYGDAVMTTFLGMYHFPRVIHLAQDVPLWGTSWDSGANLAWSNQPDLPAGLTAFQRLAAAYTLIMTLPGIPFIYYGDEVGLPGAGIPDNRRFMQWGSETAGQTLLRTRLEKLILLRKMSPALRRGSRVPVWTTQDLLAYQLVHPDQTLYVVINRSDAPTPVDGLPSGTLIDLLTDQVLMGPSFNVPPRSAMILGN